MQATNLLLLTSLKALYTLLASFDSPTFILTSWCGWRYLIPHHAPHCCCWAFDVSRLGTAFFSQTLLSTILQPLSTGERTLLGRVGRVVRDICSRAAAVEGMFDSDTTGGGGAGDGGPLQRG